MYTPEGRQRCAERAGPTPDTLGAPAEHPLGMRCVFVDRGLKPGLYFVRRSTQTLLRKRVYADTRVMGVYTPVRLPRVSTGTVHRKCRLVVEVFILAICAITIVCFAVLSAL